MGGHGSWGWGWGWGGGARTPQHNLGQLGTSPCITLTFGSSKGHVIVDGGVYVTDRDRGGEWVVRCVGQARSHGGRGGAEPPLEKFEPPLAGLGCPP